MFFQQNVCHLSLSYTYKNYSTQNYRNPLNFIIIIVPNFKNLKTNVDPRDVQNHFLPAFCGTLYSNSGLLLINHDRFKNFTYRFSRLVYNYVLDVGLLISRYLNPLKLENSYLCLTAMPIKWALYPADPALNSSDGMSWLKKSSGLQIFISNALYKTIYFFSLPTN